MIVLSIHDFEKLCDQALEELQSIGKFCEAEGISYWQTMSLSSNAYSDYPRARHETLENEISNKGVGRNAEEFVSARTQQEIVDRIKDGFV